MKKYSFILFTIIVIGFSSCNGSDAELQSKGTILSLDTSECACCGGYLIEIDGESNIYNIITLPEGNDLNIDNASYPLDVRLNWDQNVSRFCSNQITVSAISKE